MKKQRWKIGSAAFGILLGSAVFFSPGAVFIGLGVGLTGFLLYRIGGAADRRFLVGLFLAGFFLRAALSLALDLGSWAVERELPSMRGPVRGWSLGISDKTRGYLRMGDSDYYSQRAYATAQYVRGVREPVVLYRLNQYGWTGYVDFMGLFYYLFGYSPYAVKWINCFLGAFLGLLIFFIAMRCFHPTIARWAAIGTAFFPSLILWSVSNLKDVSFFVMTFLGVLLFMKLERAGPFRLKIGLAVLLGLVLFLHAMIRDGFFMVLGASFLAAWVLFRVRIKMGMWEVLFALGTGLLFLEPAALFFRSALAQVLDKHVGYVATSGTTYSFLPEIFYQPAYLREWAQSGKVDLALIGGIFKALFHFFAEPLPQRADAPLHLLVLPQMWVWYGVLFFAAAGLPISSRRGSRETLFLSIPFFFLSVFMAMANGNAGTLFRIRDLITPFALIFAASGFWTLSRDGESLRGSRLAAWFSRFTERFRPGMKGLNERIAEARRWWTGFRQGLRESFSQRVALLLACAVAAHGIWSFLLGREWTLWGTGFRIGLLLISLWGAVAASDWKTLREESLFFSVRKAS